MSALARRRSSTGTLPLVDAQRLFNAVGDDDEDVARRLTGAFLVTLSEHSDADEARAVLVDVEGDDWAQVAHFYRRALDTMPAEIDRRRDDDAAFATALDDLTATLDAPDVDLAPVDLAEQLWSVVFPEGIGILGAADEREQQLRQRRTVTITDPPAQTIDDAATQVLFTANALLTTPLGSRDPEHTDVDTVVARAARVAADEQQRYHYDHPIPVGIEPEANEILYGLTELDKAIAFEKRRGTVGDDNRLPCVLSVSVTHHGLRAVARDYVADVIDRTGGLSNLDVHVFGERETDQLVEHVLAPAARQLLERDNTDLLDVVGVDGRYGRHYSFLKAIAPLWHVLVDDRVRATFKIDLDQVFPQEVLVDKTGRSALEHLAAPLWGARGTGVSDEVELGMLAGALVNERDIATSLFTPDVTYPNGPSEPPDHVFLSKLPQALSTVAEMGTRYADGDPDGESEVVERVHVTGGTTGARVDALRRHRPFTPSFVARAEDQAYVLATYDTAGPRLSYLHADGLIMRHDKEAFAGEAIAAAAVGKLIGDHVRILLFSAYADALGDVAVLKERIDPFTGCFVSRTPVTTTLLRFALQAVALLDGDDPDDGVRFIRDGASQLGQTLAFIDGEPSELVTTVERERRGWALFYDTLDALEQALANGDPTAGELATAARRIVADAAISRPASTPAAAGPL